MLTSVDKVNCLKKSSFKAGDTIVEVVFAFAVFSLVSVIGISIMNRGSEMSQNALELNLVRNQINSQAESLRFLHENYIRELSNAAPNTDPTSITAAGEWRKVTGKSRITPGVDLRIQASTPDKLKTMLGAQGQCKYPDRSNNNAFVLNPRSKPPKVLAASSRGSWPSGFIGGENNRMLKTPSSYARLVFGPEGSAEAEADTNQISTSTGLKSVEGIWIERLDGAGYYDFYIRACWSSASSSTASTLETVVRLYEPSRN